MKNDNVSSADTIEDMPETPVIEPPNKQQGDSWQTKVHKAVEARRQMKETRQGRAMVFTSRREYPPDH